MTDIVDRLRALNADFLYEEAADEIEQLRAALRDTHQVLWQARLYLGYSSVGPLNTPFAERAEKQARSLLERER